MSLSRSKFVSPDEFWSKIEQIYGEIPNIIKLVLQVNGFNTFLALKGIRYDDKQEFFQSLEETVVELLSSDVDSDDKIEIESALVVLHQNETNFKLKPGHRNYIMNLMLEIDKTDVNDFFGRNTGNASYQDEAETKRSGQIIVQYSSPMKHEVTRRQDDPLNQVDHGYSRDEQEDQDSEFVLEEEYLTDESEDTNLIKIEYDEIEDSSRSKKRKSSTQMSSSLIKRRPDHMYNDEFLSNCTNPRRRRVTVNKVYPSTEEGTRERFTDLINQSMQCILPRDKLLEVESCSLSVEKESETSWAVYCPLCHSRIRLPVVFENGGRYCNYKRSNFERHLRFKHCKVDQRRDNYEAMEEIIEK